MDGLVTLLPPQPSSAGVAREVLACKLHEWHIDCLCDDAAIVVTELISNAVRHAATAVELRIVQLPSGVRLEVRDGSRQPLRQRWTTTDDEGGRGLHIVDALSSRHGVEPEPDGKRVWAEVLLPA